MNKDLIAIRFPSGAGGQFLNAFLTAAKLNNKIPLEFGNYGSAHNTYKEFSQHSMPIDPVNIQIGVLTNALIRCNELRSSPPYIMHTHIFDLSLLMNYAYKVINISYTLDDSPDMFYAFVGKYIFENNRDIDPWIKIQNPNIYMRKLIPNYTVEETDRILVVYWSDLFIKPAAPLIAKLSEFTNIPKENFLEENLINWRDKTMKGIRETKLFLNKYHNEHLSNPNIN